jgi:signal transduction histidine kinase
MRKKRKNKNSEKSTDDKKTTRNFLLLEFSVLSLIAFVLIGFTVVNAVRPALEGFILRKEESSTVVIMNRFASQFLTNEDLKFPLSENQQGRMKDFERNANTSGVVRFFVTDEVGVVVYSQHENYLGTSLSGNEDLISAIEGRQAIAKFKNLLPEERDILGIDRALVQVVPITFGAEETISGYVYIISRLGLIEKEIEESELAMTLRIVGGLLFLYILLFVIVWRASKTIRNQAMELADYAKTLEQKVMERTRRLEESSKRQIAQAKELTRLKDEFVFIAAHELKAPITNLRWTISEFFSSEEMQENTPSEVKEIMSVMRKASSSLVKLVSDLLNVARLESGTVKVSVHPTDLVSVIQDMVLQFKKDAEAHGIGLSFDYDKEKQFPFALSDSERLKEVFSNLISNAIKYNKPNGKISITVREKNEALMVSINHTDFGIDEEDMKHLFDKFWRSPKHKGIEGTGLGLWITKQLVERMGGEIWAESRLDLDTTFFVTLPIAKDRSLTPTKTSSKSK